VDEDLRGLVVGRQPTGAIERAARARGMSTMAQDGLAKAAAGITTVEEVGRVADLW